MQNQDDFYEIKTKATLDPVTIRDVKRFLRVEHTADDLLIYNLISSATSQGEKFTGRVFEQRTFTGKFEGLVESRYEVNPFVQLRRGPLISITSVKVMTSSVLTDVSSADYYLKQTTGYSRILFNNPPSTVDANVAYPLEVEFVCGYSEVPEDIILAIKEHTNFLYENRDDDVSSGKLKMPLGPKAIYNKYKIINTF